MGNEISWATIWKQSHVNQRAGGEATSASTHTGDRHAGEAEEEELVEPRDEDGPDHADEPSAECRTGHVGVVGVCDGGAHLGVRRVVLCAGVSGLGGDKQRLLTEVLGVLSQVGVIEFAVNPEGS